jgi:hypothetical protein
MTASRSSKQRRRRGAWQQFVYGPGNQIIGVIESRNGQWIAIGSSGQELGLCNSPEAAASLVREETSR